jgi:hypothetical protein
LKSYRLTGKSFAGHESHHYEASGGLPVLQPPYGHDLHGARASPGYRHEEEEEGKKGLEEEEEEASPGFVDSWLRRWVWTRAVLFIFFPQRQSRISLLESNEITRV